MKKIFCNTCNRETKNPIASFEWQTNRHFVIVKFEPKRIETNSLPEDDLCCDCAIAIMANFVDTHRKKT